mmetsp:Transcript_8835/g.37377  ORF Transcript_8835/g.37377 Transcript_8835/m.37377 type:complete len:212 (-) Transcript_8835:41-676(-)
MDSLECTIAPPTGTYTPPPEVRAYAFAPPYTSPGSSTACNETLFAVAGRRGSLWPGPVNRLRHVPSLAADASAMPPRPWSAPEGSASTGATSAAPSLNQLVFCHQLASLGDGVAGARGEDEGTVAPAPHRRRRMFSGSSEATEPSEGPPFVWAGAYDGCAGRDSTAAMPLAGPARNAESAEECTAAGSSGRWVAAVIEEAGRGGHAGAFAW